jgi:hypothetical protein
VQEQKRSTHSPVHVPLVDEFSDSRSESERTRGRECSLPLESLLMAIPICYRPTGNQAARSCEGRPAVGVVLLEATEPRRESGTVPSPVCAAAVSSVG